MDLTVNNQGGRTYIQGKSRYDDTLSHIPGEILGILLEKADRFVSFEHLVSRLWEGEEVNESTRGRLRIHNFKIRQFLEKSGTNYELLTVAGRGYLLKTEDNE